MNNRKLRINSAVLISAAVVIVILINVFVSALGSKFPLKLDFTSGGMFELSEKTKEFLKTYDTPVDIYILASSSGQDERISSALGNYAAENKNIKITNINTAENPTFGKKYVKDGESLTANTVIVDSGERFKVNSLTELYGLDAQSGKYTSLNVENKINSALKYVASDTQLKAYMTAGHNEMTVDGVINKLESENYEVASWTSLTEEIPKDASVIMAVRPTADFSMEEISKLDSYLQDGGSVQFYFDADSVGLSNLYSYIRQTWGIGVNDSYVVEADMSKTVALGSSGIALIVPVVKETEFTESILRNKRTIAYFPYSKPLTQEFEANGSVEVTPLLTGSDKAYIAEGETPERLENDGAECIVAALCEDNAHGSSVYVSGNTMLLSIDPTVLTNDYGLANYDYFMNLTGYTTGGDESFLVGEKALINNVISMSQLTASVIFLIVVIAIPLIILIYGIVVWAKRRNL